MASRNPIILSLLALLMAACSKDKLQVVKQNPQDIGSLDATKRYIEINSTDNRYKNTFYAEFQRNFNESNYRGYEFNLYDEKNKDILTVLRILRLKTVGDTTVQLEPGVFYTNSLLFGTTTDVIVEIELNMDGMSRLFRATEFKPNNKVTINRINANTLSIDYSIVEMRNNTGFNEVLNMHGHFELHDTY